MKLTSFVHVIEVSLCVQHNELGPVLEEVVQTIDS
jgi:hypothetical protein